MGDTPGPQRSSLGPSLHPRKRGPALRARRAGVAADMGRAQACSPAWAGALHFLAGAVISK